MQTQDDNKSARELIERYVRYVRSYDGEPQYIVKKQYIGMKGGDILKLIPDCEVYAKDEETKDYIIEYYNQKNTRLIILDIINDVCVFAIQTIGSVVEHTDDQKQ